MYVYMAMYMQMYGYMHFYMYTYVYVDVYVYTCVYLCLSNTFASRPTSKVQCCAVLYAAVSERRGFRFLQEAISRLGLGLFTWG